MSNENQILIQVQQFMNYWHPEIPRNLPVNAQSDYNMLRDVINLHFAPKPAIAKSVKKKAKKKVSKKK